MRDLRQVRGTGVMVAALLLLGAGAGGCGERPEAANDQAAALSWSRIAHDEAVFGGPGRQQMHSVVVRGPGLVAVGSDLREDGVLDGVAAVWTSPDGRTWSRIPHDDAVFGGPGRQEMFSVVVGGQGLVAVGSDVQELGGVGAVWTSPDGQTWSRVPHDEAVFGGPGQQDMKAVVAGGPGLVAVGSEIHGSEGVAAVWTSPDGQTWSRVPHDEAVFGGSVRQVMTSVTAGGQGLVAVGEDLSSLRGEEGTRAAVWTSPDGQAWSRVPHDEAVFGEPTLGGMASVTAGGSGLVAVGAVMQEREDMAAVPAVWTSPDGQTWSRAALDEARLGGPGVQTMKSAAAGGPGLVAVGADWRDAVAAVWTSPDGQTWTRVAHDEAVFGGPGDQSMASVMAGGPGLVAVGEEFHPQGSAAAVWVAE